MAFLNYCEADFIFRFVIKKKNQSNTRLRPSIKILVYCVLANPPKSALPKK